MKKGAIAWMDPYDLRSDIRTGHADAPYIGLHVIWIDGGFYVVDDRARNGRAPATGPYKDKRLAMRAAERLVRKEAASVDGGLEVRDAF